MDFYLTTEAGTTLRFPLNPERVMLSTGARMETHEVINLGELSLPRGKTPDRVKWEGIFPGEPRKNMPFVKDWKVPKDWVDILKNSEVEGEKLRLLITETSINLDVYISTFDPSWSGGFGDISYSIEFIEVRSLLIPLKGDSNISSIQSIQAARPSPPTPQTYTVVSGDTLSAIGKKSGKKWQDIYNEPTNRKTIGPNPDKIYPGQVLIIPG